MQVSWARHTGLYTIQANYTWQKALGIVSPTGNPFSLSADYGIQPTDRRNLFNAAYSIDLGQRLHVNPFVNGALNGWQFSGVTQLESGANVTYSGGYNASTNYNLQITCTDPNKTGKCATGAFIPGTRTTALPGGVPMNNQSILGTNGQQLNPLVTCNPSANTGSHQFVNPSCFAVPTVPRQNGPNLLPVSYGPGFFNSDLAVFKNFAITEKRKLQIRAQAYNFLNHPLYSFPSGSNLTLTFDQDPVSEKFTQTNANFGKTTEKQGQRIVEFAAKFYF